MKQHRSLFEQLFLAAYKTRGCKTTEYVRHIVLDLSDFILFNYFRSVMIRDRTLANAKREGRIALHDVLNARSRVKSSER